MRGPLGKEQVGVVMLGRYRRVLAAPKVGAVLLITFGDRVPKYMAILALTLHCVQYLGMGYGAAGTLIAAYTIGDIAAAPFVGRYVDRWGVRRTVAVGGVCQTAFYLGVPFLDYRWLLVAAFVRAFAPVPTNLLARQALSTLVPAADRRTAIAMDSMGLEVAMMVGPALAVFAATQASSRVLFFAVAAALSVAAVGWLWVNPSLQAVDGAPEQAGRARRGLLNPQLLTTMFCSVAVGVVLSGTDVGIVASSREVGQLQWAGIVITIWCLASLVGGFLYGAAHRPPGLAVLLLLLSGATALTGAISAVATQWWMIALALVPAGLFCAPSLTSATEHAGLAVRDSARGQAISLQLAAVSTGIVIGTPLAGFVTDHSGHAAWGYLAVAGCGCAAALLAMVLGMVSRKDDMPPHDAHDVDPKVGAPA
jgi:predicted MFS family arabinose efflux permease